MTIKNKKEIKNINIRYDTIGLIMTELISVINKIKTKSIHTFELQTDNIPGPIKNYNRKSTRLFDIDSVFIKKVCDCLLEICMLGNDNCYKYYNEDLDENIMRFYFIHDANIIKISITEDSNWSIGYSITVISSSNWFSEYPINILYNIVQTYIRKKEIVKKFLYKEYL